MNALPLHTSARVGCEREENNCSTISIAWTLQFARNIALNRPAKPQLVARSLPIILKRAGKQIRERNQQFHPPTTADTPQNHTSINPAEQQKDPHIQPMQEENEAEQ